MYHMKLSNKFITLKADSRVSDEVACLSHCVRGRCMCIWLSCLSYSLRYRQLHVYLLATDCLLTKQKQLV